MDEPGSYNSPADTEVVYVAKLVAQYNSEANVITELGAKRFHVDIMLLLVASDQFNRFSLPKTEHYFSLLTPEEPAVLERVMRTRQDINSPAVPLKCF